jgi:hypothetical protein
MYGNELKIPKRKIVHIAHFVILENCDAHFYHAKYMEDDNKIARNRFFTPHISYTLHV